MLPSRVKSDIKTNTKIENEKFMHFNRILSDVK